MNIKLIFTITSSILGIFCFIPYIIDIFRHKTKPHIYSWLIWTILQTIGVVVMFKSGAGIGASSLAIGVLFCAFIFILSFKYGTHNIKRIDTICLVGALISLLIYVSSQNLILSLVMVALTDVVGFFPTIRKSYVEPQTETALTYILSATSSILALFALSEFNLNTSLYVISLVVTNGICGAIILVRRNTITSLYKNI